MTRINVSLFACFLMLAVAVSVYAAPAVEVSGELNLSGTGTISFPDGTLQKTAATDCTGRYELNRNMSNPNGDGTVTDCRTGLIWLKNAKCTDTSGNMPNTLGYLTWTNANSWVAGLGDGLCGLHDGSSAGDWRLPTKTEWMAMVQSARNQGYECPALTNEGGTGHWAAGDIFDNVQIFSYWSGTSADTLNAWYVTMCSGATNAQSKVSMYTFIWPVRSGR